MGLFDIFKKPDAVLEQIFAAPVEPAVGAEEAPSVTWENLPDRSLSERIAARRRELEKRIARDKKTTENVSDALAILHDAIHLNPVESTTVDLRPKVHPGGSNYITDILGTKITINNIQHWGYWNDKNQIWLRFKTSGNKYPQSQDTLVSVEEYNKWVHLSRTS